MFFNKLKIVWAGKADEDTSIIPVPQSNEYQTIKSISFLPEGIKLARLDDLFENKIIVHENKIDWKLSLNISLKDIKKTINPSLSINDYSQDQNKYLIEDEYINGGNVKITSIAKNLFGEEKNCKKIISSSYKFVLEYLSYGKPIKELYPFTQAVEEKITDCGGYSTLLASLLQSRKIPTRLVVGHLISGKRLELIGARTGIKTLKETNLSMHAWLEALLPDGSWFPMDPSIEWRRNKKLTGRKGGFGYIPADRIVLSFGYNISIQIKNKTIIFPILQHIEKINI